jgi:hypothetical protein
MLAAGGFLAGRQAGVRGWRLGIEVAGAAAFGLLLALLMVGLHLAGGLAARVTRCGWAARPASGQA